MVLAMGLLASACGERTPAPAMPDDEFEKLTPSEALGAERKSLSSCGDVTAEGYCGVRFGMTVAEAQKAFPVAFASIESAAAADTAPDRCYELFAVAPVMGVSMLAEGGKVGRFDFITEAARTEEGFGVGTQASAIRTHYGDKLHIETNALESEITDLAAMAGETKFVFEIQDGIVRAWRAGVAPTVDYVAHCG